MPAVAIPLAFGYTAILFFLLASLAVLATVQVLVRDAPFIGGLLNNAAQWVYDRVNEAAVALVGAVQNALAAWGGMWTTLVNNVVQPALDWLRGIVHEATGDIAALDAEIRGDVAGAIGSLWNWARGAYDVASAAIAAVEGLRLALTTALGSVAGNVAQLQQGLYEALGVQQTATSAALAQQAALIAELSERLAVAETARAAGDLFRSQLAARLSTAEATLAGIESVVTAHEQALGRIAVLEMVATVGMVGAVNLTRLARNPCYCLDGGGGYDWVPTAVEGLLIGVP